MTTVHEAIQKDRQCDEAAEAILDIYAKLDPRQQLITHAVGNQAMAHHFEKHDCAVERSRSVAKWKESIEEEE